MGLFRDNIELKYRQACYGKTIGKSREQRRMLAFIRFWEETGEDCFEEKFIGEEQEFKIVVVSHWLQSGVWLPTVSNRQIFEAELGDKGKRSLFKCCTTWEDGVLPTSRLIRLISFAKHRQNPAISRKTKTQVSAQNSCSILICPLEPVAAKPAAVWLQAASLESV